MLHLGSGSRHLPLARIVAASIAARTGFDMTAVADFKLAVDETCAMLMNLAAPGGAVECRFAIDGPSIRFGASVQADDAVAIDQSGVGWTLMTSLADDVTTESRDDGEGTLICIDMRATP